MTRNPQQTRDRLLEAAFQEMHSHGFQGMRVDEVLRQAGLQKGAFYHHFSSKTELGYAVVEEQINQLVENIWLDPVKKINNPLTGLPDMLESLAQRIPPMMQEHGCPLNNLAQEMASQDEGFNKRVALLFNRWIQSYTQLFETAQKNGYVRKNVEADQIARFVVAVLEGCIGLSKAENASEQWAACHSQLTCYLRGLKP